jgi:hypothetical protein
MKESRVFIYSLQECSEFLLVKLQMASAYLAEMPTFTGTKRERGYSPLLGPNRFEDGVTEYDKEISDIKRGSQC